jgi:hypothetical protein
MLIHCGTNESWGLIWEAERKNAGVLGIALAIRALPNAVGEEATPPGFTFFEDPVYAPGRLQSTCVRSCLETRDRRYLRRSLTKIFSAACWSSECQASRLPVVRWRLEGCRYRVHHQLGEALSFKPTTSFIGIKKRSHKSNKTSKPLLCLRSWLRSSRAFRPEPRGG